MYNIWTYSYMNVILRKGTAANNQNNNNNNSKVSKIASSEDEDHEDDSNQNENDSYHLTSDDLFPVPREMKSSKLVSKFESYWEKSNNTNSNTKNSKKTNTKNTKIIITTKTILLKTLWNISKSTFVPAGIYQLISTLCASTMPLIVRQLLFVLESGNTNSIVIHDGLIWSCLLTLMTFINGLSNHRHQHQSMKTGIAIRIDVITYW
jgi:hypothetical protein